MPIYLHYQTEIDSLVEIINKSTFDDTTFLSLQNFEKETNFAMQ